MLITEARIATERPSRYLVQLCKHFDNKGRHLGHRPRVHGDGDAQALREMQAVAAQAQVEWSEAQGTVTLPWGRCEMRAEPGALTVRVEAVDAEKLERLQDLLAGHIERFGRREQLTVNWGGPNTSTVAHSETAKALSASRKGGGSRHPWRGRAAVLTALVVLALVVHLGLGSLLFSQWRWTGWAAGILLAVVLVKIGLLTGLGRFAARRARTSRAR
ncbi:DUF2218 domain-containing protein [Streptomyces sp. NPDC049627]|uniref:DUF2218 domain-containing protein n=1 Tax=Streptomyces sp. NPDC049627 TaxID=3365595 RepID=UPI0037B3AB1E